MARSRNFMTPLCLAIFACLGVTGAAVEEPPRSERQAIAIVVHKKNPITDVKFSELRSLLRLERQFWADRSRVSLYLPAAESPEKEVLNSTVYKMTEKQLQKYWTGKVFAGEIPSIPPVARTASAAARLVSHAEGAISVIPASEVTEDVKVLTIDGHSTDQPEYPLWLPKVETPPEKLEKNGTSANE